VLRAHAPGSGGHRPVNDRHVESLDTRKEIADANDVDAGLFSFNSKGG
jgi:hypothetical protein